MLRVVILVFTLLLFSTPAYALRCGNRVASIGDRQIEVRRFCGEPAAKNFYHVIEGERVTIDNNFEFETRKVNVIEEWVYNFGPRNLIIVLTFKNGRLIKEETEDYGFL